MGLKPRPKLKQRPMTNSSSQCPPLTWYSPTKHHLALSIRTYFVPAASADVSLPPRLCTWLPGRRSSTRVTPQCTSTTALFDYISAGRSTHCACYHWRPHLSSDCCIGLEQSAGVGPVVSVVASFPEQTENRTFCLVLQS